MEAPARPRFRRGGMNVPVVVGGGGVGILLVLPYVAFQLLGGSLSFADWVDPATGRLARRRVMLTRAARS
jgi:hypothetical protein